MGPVKATEPHENDVLCGRGGYINSHPGNERFRKLVEKRKRVYLAARFKQEKRLVANSIVSDIRDLEGRFLAKHNNTGDWYDIGDEKARDKTSQALRENAPTIRAEITDGANQLRNKKTSAKRGTTGKKKGATDGSTKGQMKSKKGRKESSGISSEIGNIHPNDHWNQTTPYYQQPPHYYPPPHGYAPYYPPHSYSSSGWIHPGQHHEESQLPPHTISSMAAPAPFPRGNEKHPANDIHTTTECVPSSTDASFTAPAPESAWQGSERSHSKIFTKENQHRSRREDKSWKYPDTNSSQNSHKDSALLRQAANQIMGWDSRTRGLEDPMEYEIGQEVELLDMDYQVGEDHRAANNSRLMAPPPARLKPRTTDADWSNILGCQSSWLPDAFASPSPANNALPSPASFDMDTSIVGAEGGISFTGSLGGNSLSNAFSQDQVLDCGSSIPLSKAHSLASSVHSLTSAPSLSHHASFKTSPSWDRTMTNSGRCKSPLSEQSLVSKGSGFECQISPVATSSSNITRIHSRSRSSGSRSCRRKVAPSEGGFH